MMKFKLSVLLLVAITLSQACGAQLRLFPKNGHQEVLDTTLVKTDTVVVTAPETVRIALLLPFGDNSEKTNYLGFYGGFLLGVQSLSGNGIKMEINTYDSTMPLPEDAWNCHLIVDARPAGELKKEKGARDKGPYRVIPLEQEAESLTDSMKIVLVPGTWKTRTREMVNWIKEDWCRGDSLFVISSGSTPDEKTRFLLSCMQKKGLRYRLSPDYASLDYSLIQGTARFAIVAEDANCTASAVNFLSGTIKENKAETALYCTSRLRSWSKRFEEDALGNAGTHMVSSYYIDYNLPETDNFIRSYRLYYEGEPNQFAFDGYDTARYFIPLAARYGEFWADSGLKEGFSRGLLTDFRFRREEGGKGWVNAGLRRIRYSEDLNESVESSSGE